MEMIEQLTNELDAEINRVWTEYLNLHTELNAHQGKPIDDTNLDEVNRILKEYTGEVCPLYPAYHFIATRHQYASNAVTSVTMNLLI